MSIATKLAATTFTEVFPVDTTKLPPFFAYELNIKGEDASAIGRSLTYHLKRRLGGHWVWVNNRLVSDIQKSAADLKGIVATLWNEQPDKFKDLQEIIPDPAWQVHPLAQAEFVARGLAGDLEAKIRETLAEKHLDLGNARIDRTHDIRGWVVQGEPALSISITSRLLHKHDLKTYFIVSKANPENLKGVMVADKASTLKGEITGVVGNLSQHRTHLLEVSSKEESKNTIKRASDDELVVRVWTGQKHYDYVMSALRIIVRTQDFNRFKINGQQALQALRIEPGSRSQLVATVSSLLRSATWITQGYRSDSSPELFLSIQDIGFNPFLRLGSNRTCRSDDTQLYRNLGQYGIYKRSPKFPKDIPIRIGIINTLDSSIDLTGFKAQMQAELKRVKFASLIVSEVRTQGTSRIDLETAVEESLQHAPDILLAFLPDEEDEDEEDEWGSYEHFKDLTVRQGIPSQVVNPSTLKNQQWAMGNIVLGMIGKTGNVPFILDQTPDGIDFIVGIDVARQRKQRLAGSMNATATARVYFGNGEFLRYVIYDAPIEGETIPENVLQRLFPLKEFRGKRVIIHRDGYFRGQEKEALKKWARQIGAEFYLVEIIKTGAPRMYALQEKKIQQPPKGSIFKLSEHEAFLVSTLPPFKTATPRPLHIRTEAPFTIEQAIHSVLSLTLLHYGSLRPPRLPVTIHYSDKIAYMALRGIKPKDLEGAIPFWL